MSSRRSVPEPMHQCAVAHHFTSSQPTFSRVALVGCGQSSTQIPPGRLMTTSAAMCAQVVLVTIPIGNRCCLTQRFSPTGFILNAPDSLTAIIATPYARIQDKTCTFNSITRSEASKNRCSLAKMPRQILRGESHKHPPPYYHYGTAKR